MTRAQGRVKPPVLQLYTMEETAAQLAVSRRWLQSFIQKNPFFVTAGRRKLFSADHILSLFEAMKCPSGLSHPTPRGGRRATPYAARTSSSTFTEALELAKRLTRERNSKGSRQKSNRGDGNPTTGQHSKALL